MVTQQNSPSYVHGEVNGLHGRILIQALLSLSSVLKKTFPPAQPLSSLTLSSFLSFPASRLRNHHPGQAEMVIALALHSQAERGLAQDLLSALGFIDGEMKGRGGGVCSRCPPEQMDARGQESSLLPASPTPFCPQIPLGPLGDPGGNMGRADYQVLASHHLSPCSAQGEGGTGGPGSCLLLHRGLHPLLALDQTRGRSNKAVPLLFWGLHSHLQCV